MFSLIRRMLDPNDSSIQSHEVGGLVALVCHVGVAIHQQALGHIVDLQGFGLGAGAIIAATKAAAAMDAKAQSMRPGGQ